MGFCLFNNVAIGARMAVQQLQLDRVLIVECLGDSKSQAPEAKRVTERDLKGQILWQAASLWGAFGPYRQTINESDLEIYRDALAAPAAHAEFVLAFDGDEIAQAVRAHPTGLALYRRLIAMLPALLAPQAPVLFEAAPGTIEPLAALVAAAFPGARPQIAADYAGLGRYIAFTLEGRTL